MKIDTPFDIGDRIYYVKTAEPEENGIPMAQIKSNENDTVQAILYTEADKCLIVSDGEPMQPGEQYSCLSTDQAMDWIRWNRPSSLLLTGKKAIKAVLVSRSGERSIVTLYDDYDSIGAYVYMGSVACGHMDARGYAAIYDRTAHRSGAPISTFIRDQYGNPVDAMYGAFLLVRLAERADHLYELEDVKEDVLPPAPDQEPCPGQDLYSPVYWKQMSDMTVDDFCRYLKDTYPGNARMAICGASTFYGHYCPDRNIMSVDRESLSDMPGYEDKEPEKKTGSLLEEGRNGR